MDQAIFTFFGYLINIDSIILYLFIFGAFLLYTRWLNGGRRVIRLTLVVLLLTSVVPTGFWTIAWLENRFSPPQSIGPDVKGIILLGGSFNLTVSADRQQPSYNLAGGRLIEVLALAHKYPNLPILFSGGGNHSNPFANEAELTKKVFASVGFNTDRMLFEKTSKNTVENAQKSYEMMRPEPGDQWLLVTSAYHMPRAVGLFRNAGWEVVPYPVDYHSIKAYPWYFIQTKISAGLQAWSMGIRELGGMTTNYVAGRSDQWIPKPKTNM